VGEFVIGRLQVEHRDVEAVGAQPGGDVRSETRTSSGDDGILHDCSPVAGRSRTFSGLKNHPSDYENRTLGAARAARSEVNQHAAWVDGGFAANRA
jgi:hypothetical protein